MPPNLYFTDVREDYFEGYRTHLHPFYKDKDGVIVDYEEMSPDFLYRKPLYTQKQMKSISLEAQRLVMYNNKDYEKIKKKLQEMGRTEDYVIIFSIILVSPGKLSSVS